MRHILSLCSIHQVDTGLNRCYISLLQLVSIPLRGESCFEHAIDARLVLTTNTNEENVTLR